MVMKMIKHHQNWHIIKPDDIDYNANRIEKAASDDELMAAFADVGIDEESDEDEDEEEEEGSVFIRGTDDGNKTTETGELEESDSDTDDNEDNSDDKQKPIFVQSDYRLAASSNGTLLYAMDFCVYNI